MKIKEISDLTDAGIATRKTRDCARRTFTCACSSRAASSKSRASSAPLRRDVARIETVLTAAPASSKAAAEPPSQAR